MKATQLLLLVLSCMLIVGCKNNETEDEPTPPVTQTDTISATELQSYFPYKNMDKLDFVAGGGDLVLYIVTKSQLSYENKRMLLSTVLDGTQFGDSSHKYNLSLNAEVTNGTVLKVDFLYKEPYAGELKASYTHDITKDGDIPEEITFSSEDVKVTIKKDKGLTCFYEMLSHWKWVLIREY